LTFAAARSFLISGSFDNDFPFKPINNVWDDTRQSGFSDPKVYAVQTATKVVERCLLMTTEPGDLVLDPTCGSGTTAYVAEKCGRRWIMIDVSRVPLALARQCLLTATFPWYELKDETRGPSGGFVYTQKRNRKGEHVGGLVPHKTLRSIANGEPPAEEVLVDRPEIVKGITRVTGPFAVEGTIPPALDLPTEDTSKNPDASSAERFLEVLRRVPVLHLPGNKTVTFKNVRPPAKPFALGAEALVQNGKDRPVAFAFGPQNGSVTQKLVLDAATEARAKGYTHLYVIGFAIEPNARHLVEQCEEISTVPATYVQATPDLLMGNLLKNIRSSQIFSVCGLPDVQVTKTKGNGKRNPERYQVTLVGLDVFDPVTAEVTPTSGNDVPAWFLDTDYNDLCFHVCQAFFPRTHAWDALKKALKGTHDESVWDHLAGTTSAPFEAGDFKHVAVKVIDERGNELLVVKKLADAE
jgi:adenine-specific DNA-methyltransferase